jgi:hypothetical protein
MKTTKLTYPRDEYKKIEVGDIVTIIDNKLFPARPDSFFVYYCTNVTKNTITILTYEEDIKSLISSRAIWKEKSFAEWLIRKLFK